jgi:hypothetical protein
MLVDGLEKSLLRPVVDPLYTENDGYLGTLLRHEEEL